MWKDEHTDGIIRRTHQVRLAKHAVQVAEVHDLMAMKLRADRPQDDYDIAEILRNGAIEVEKVRHLATAEQFQRFHAIQTRIAKKRP